MTTKFLTTAVLSLTLIGGASFVEAGQHSRGGGGSAGSAGRAVPRSVGPNVVAPRGGVVVRPSYGPYFRGYGYYGYPYGYAYYPYGLGFGFGYPYGYAYGGYGYGYGYGGYGYPYGGYAATGYAGGAYGGVRITDAPREAAVYADGYYVGIVDDFDGAFQRVNLEPGAHHIEIVPPQGGQPPVSIDVNVRPGQTITYRAY